MADYNLKCRVSLLRVHVRNSNKICSSSQRCALKKFDILSEEAGWAYIGRFMMPDPGNTNCGQLPFETFTFNLDGNGIPYEAEHIAFVAGRHETNDGEAMEPYYHGQSAAISQIIFETTVGSLDCPSEHLMGNLEGYSGETCSSTVDWRACATKCSTSSSCKAWQFVNSNCVMVESYQRTKAVDGLFGLGAWGWSRMRIKFDTWLLLPRDNFLREFLITHDTFYPDNGETIQVYSETFNYTHLDTIDELVRGFKELEEKKTIREVNPWWTKIKSYVVDKKNFATWEELAYDLPCLNSMRRFIRDS